VQQEKAWQQFHSFRAGYEQTWDYKKLLLQSRPMRRSSGLRQLPDWKHKRHEFAAWIQQNGRRRFEWSAGDEFAGPDQQRRALIYAVAAVIGLSGPTPFGHVSAPW